MTVTSEPTGAPGPTAALHTVPLEDKVRTLTGADAWSTHPLPAVGLKPLILSDGPVGPRGPAFGGGADQPPSLLFPSPSSMAATWDNDAVFEAGSLMGAKAAEMGIHVLLAPTVNLHRSPLGGRHFECYSEDPLLTARIAARLIEGVQSHGVAATIKHFVGNDSETDRMSYDARIDEKALREVYLLPFEVAVREARVWAVMAAYNGVNGARMTESRRLLTEVLKDEWGFDGVVVSDWEATRSTAASALAGLDLVMPGPNGPWGEQLTAAVRDGSVPESVVDDKLDRLVRLATRTGALEGATVPAPRPGGPADVLAEARDRLKALAIRGSVLLRNDGVLPLDTHDLHKVALIGPNAVKFAVQGGGSANVKPEHETTLGDALSAVLGREVEVTMTAGAFPHQVLGMLPQDRAVDPVSNDAGVFLSVVDADGKSLGDEHKPVEPFHFPILLPPGAEEVVLRTRLTLDRSGVHRLSVLGIGQFAVTVGGHTEIFEQLMEEPDFARLLLHTPSTAVPFAAEAGEVEVTVRLRPQAGLPHPVALLGIGYEAPRRDDDAELAAAVEAARTADAVVLVVGTGDEFERESVDRSTLALPGRQDELVDAVCAANPRTVVVVNAGAPVLMPWIDRPAAVLWAWFPGQEGAEAVADILTGAEPGGRLPTTFPAAETDSPVLATEPVDGAIDYAEGSLLGYRAYPNRGTRPLFPFGHGLSYTEWAYRDLQVTRGELGVDVSFEVQNSGDRAGRDVAQVYLESPGEPLRLVGYACVDAAAGVSTRVALDVDDRTLSRWSDHGWAITPGLHRIRVGRSSADLPLTAELRLG
ncbi:beta-glucosidase [Streptodolium elevatio]